MEWIFLTFDNILTLFMDKNSKKWPNMCRGSTIFPFSQAHRVIFFSTTYYFFIIQVSILRLNWVPS